MNEYEFINSLKKIIKENVTLSCGLKFFDDTDGVFSFTVIETNDDIALWRLNELLDTLKRRLYQNGVQSIYCTFGGFNEVNLRCHYIVKDGEVIIGDD